MHFSTEEEYRLHVLGIKVDILMEEAKSECLRKKYKLLPYFTLVAFISLSVLAVVWDNSIYRTLYVLLLLYTVLGSTTSL